MKAVCLMAPFDVRIREIPDPERSQGQALLKILSAGICGSDVNAYRGGGKKFRYPSVIGHEIAAEILDVDEGTGFAKGDRVLINHRAHKLLRKPSRFGLRCGARRHERILCPSGPSADPSSRRD